MAVNWLTCTLARQAVLGAGFEQSSRLLGAEIPLLTEDVDVVSARLRLQWRATPHPTYRWCIRPPHRVHRAPHGSRGKWSSPEGGPKSPRRRATLNISFQSRGPPIAGLDLNGPVPMRIRRCNRSNDRSKSASSSISARPGHAEDAAAPSRNLLITQSADAVWSPSREAACTRWVWLSTQAGKTQRPAASTTSNPDQSTMPGKSAWNRHR